MNDETSERINIAEFSTQVDAWFAHFRRSPPEMGAVDIICLGRDSTLRRASTFALSSTGAATEAGPMFAAAYILLGPSHGGANSDDSLNNRIAMCRQNVSEAWMASEKTPPSQDVERALRARIRALSLDRYVAEAIPKLLGQVEPRSAVVVPNAARYSIGPGPSARKFGDLHTPSREWEDLWVARIEEIVRAALPIVRERELYVLLDTGEYSPLRPENFAHLMAPENQCNLTGARPADDLQAALLRHEQFRMEAGDKALASSVATIGAMESNELVKAILRAEYVARAGRNQEAYQILRPHLPKLCRIEDYRRLLQIAELAHRAGHPWDSTQLLRLAMEQGLHEETLLHRALELAWGLGEKDRAAAIQTTLSALYPESAMTFTALAQSMTSAHVYGAVGASAKRRLEHFAEDKTAAYYSMLAQELGVETEPRYEQIVEQAGALDPALLPSAVTEVIGDALSRNLTLAAVRILRDPRARLSLSEKHAGVALNVLERALLDRVATGDSVEKPNLSSAEDLDDVLAQVIVYLGQHPSDTRTRNRLIRILSPGVSGLHGFSLLMIRVLSSIPSLMSVSVLPITDRESAPLDEMGSFLEEALSHIQVTGSHEGGNALILGIGTLPQAGRKHSPRELFEGMRTIILRFSSGMVIDEGDLRASNLYLHIGLLLASEFEDDTADIRLIGLTGEGIAISGSPQQARNLAEHALALVGPGAPPMRRRTAWISYADIYHRLHSELDSMIGLACALSVPALMMDAEHAWDEIYLLIRLLRDLRMYDEAVALMPRAREIIRVAGVGWHRRLAVIEATIWARMFFDRGPTSPKFETELAAVLRRLADLAQEIIANADEILPVAITLAQAHMLARDAGLPIDEGIDEVVTRSLTLVPSAMRARIAALTAPTPGPEHVNSLAWAIDGTLYDEDLAADVRPVELLLRRMLGQRMALGDVPGVLFALEWLCDHSVQSPAPPKGSSASDDVANRRFPTSLTSIREWCEALAMVYDDYEFHLVGHDWRGRIVRGSFSRAGLGSPVEESAAGRFILAEHQRWSQVYPYRYGFMDDSKAPGSAEFVRTMTGVGFSAFPHTRTWMFVFEPDLQNVPTNIALINGEMAGTINPTVTVPSLAWLLASRKLPRRAAVKRFGWIPAPIPDSGADEVLSDPSSAKLEGLAALDVLRDSLEPVFVENNFEFSRSSTIPERIGDADIVVIGAHGRVDDNEAFFRVMADEANARFAPRKLAERLADAAVVVLFVCSAGRVDSDPFLNKSIGLPWLLLDEGCRTVIASPWPLNVGVPARWLRAFLHELTMGWDVAEAAFFANHEVRRWSDQPANWLAMHVFGDARVFKDNMT